jgi:hypothetical protein
MNGEKAFVVAQDSDTYDLLIRFHQLDPGLCFQCDTAEEAAIDIIKNHLIGIRAAMWTAAGRWHYDIEQIRAASLERRMMEAA